MKVTKEQIAKLSPPWYVQHRKVLALFGSDPEVTVRELEKTSDTEYVYFILVSNLKKAQAIKAILNNPVEFSGGTVTAVIFGPDEDSEVKAADLDDKELFENAFAGNPVLDRIETTQLAFFVVTFCIFKKQVIQYWSDNFGDYYGQTSCLAEDLARELLKETLVQFCTGIE